VGREKFPGGSASLALRGIRVEGHHRHRCLRLTLFADVRGSGEVCEREHRPVGNWQRLLGIGDNNDNPTIELDVTRKRVRKLRLLLGPDDRSWHRFHTHRISRAEARAAHVSPDFRYAILHRRQTLCVEKVKTFDRAGKQLDNFRVPCEY
jgi:hypothetical protein